MVANAIHKRGGTILREPVAKPAWFWGTGFLYICIHPGFSRLGWRNQLGPLSTPKDCLWGGCFWWRKKRVESRE